ncbi:hypothetical protein DVH24_035463 [Malus domestica]|uniref:Uncharacterized protein n=1 Tax=Malus domestica TaxID=3750 RepID=A0A498J4J1_MALDO|nr:hypothetical protein DVH24_035463 [Malus domestica]
MEKTNVSNKKEVTDKKAFLDLVFSWSLSDVLNNKLYKNQVPRIPETFLNVTSYLKSFVPSLIEETHADLLSNMITELSHAPTCEILALECSKGHKNPQNLVYDIAYKIDTEADQKHNGLMYEPQVGDLIALTDVKPKCIDDLNRFPRHYVAAYVSKVPDPEEFPDAHGFTILSSKPIDYGEQDGQKSKRQKHFAVYLMNMTTNLRVWCALNSKEGNTNIIKKVLQPNSYVVSSCTTCSPIQRCSPALSTIWPTISSHNLNDSQEAAVLNFIGLSKCHHQNDVKLIWGPPGTGKTKTVSLSLFALLMLKCRTLTCAPTNIAVLEVAARLRSLVNRSLEFGKYGLGDIVLFGNKKRMKVDDKADLLEVFLDHRIKILIKCLAPLSGWKHLLRSMIRLLEEPEEEYSLYLQKKAEEHKESAQVNEKKNMNRAEKHKESAQGNQKKNTKRAEKHKESAQGNQKKNMKRAEKHKESAQGNGKGTKGNTESVKEDDPLTFEEFVKKEFDSIFEPLKICLVNLHTHLPTSCISLKVVKDMVEALGLLKSFKSSMHSISVAKEGLNLVLKDFKVSGSIACCFTQLGKKCVCFTDQFEKSIVKIKDNWVQREVFNLLTKLSSGWRQAHKAKGMIVHDGTCSQLLETYKVNRLLNLIWTVDIIQENSDYIQVMKVWAIVTSSDIPRLAKRLDIIFGSYTVDTMNRCKHKCIDKGTAIPMRWPVDSSSYHKADPVEFLSKPLSSLGLTDKPETSTSASGEAIKTEKQSTQPKSRLKSHAKQRRQSPNVELAGDGEVSYRLALPPYLSSSIYDVFHISALKKNIAVVSHVLNWYNLSIQKHLLCDEKP